MKGNEAGPSPAKKGKGKPVATMSDSELTPDPKKAGRPRKIDT
jgi:hypothetical protein